MSGDHVETPRSLLKDGQPEGKVNTLPVKIARVP